MKSDSPMNNTDQERTALDELFVHAELVARGQMASMGKILPAMVLRTSSHEYIDVELSQLETLTQRGTLQETIRAACIEADVAASTMLLPNTLTAAGNEKQEVALILGATRSLREERAMPMMRTPQGQFLGFADTWRLPHSQEAEAYQEFIPREEPTMAQRSSARATLSRVGISISSPCERGHHAYRERQAERDKGEEYCR
jgi:hypothetical protein